MNKLNFQNKQNGDPLDASEWNSVVSKIDELVESTNNGGNNTPVVIDSSGILSTSSKGNVTLGSGKNINIEPAWNNNAANYSGNEGDIALKPGDDIQFCSHHRAFKKRDKIVIKNIDGSDNPVKAQIVAGELELAVGTQNNPKSATKKKNKTTGVDTEETMFKANDAKVLDVKVLTGYTLDSGQETERDERGYLKVRAQAIDLRCEKHGGIALQPKGYDSDGNMNKIKFEHGGGDGLEFGTFNTEKTSIFTNEYRFNKDGIWKMAVRETTPSGKTIIDEREGGLQGLSATGSLQYKKNNSSNNASKSIADQKTYEPADDFYDFVDTEDPQTTTEAIIKTAAALNNNYIETYSSSKKNLKISSISTYKIVRVDIIEENQISERQEEYYSISRETEQPSIFNRSFTKDELKEILSSKSYKLSDYIGTSTQFLVKESVVGLSPSLGASLCKLQSDINPKISIESENEVDLDAKYGDVVINSGDTIKCEAPEIRLNALNKDKTGGMVNFGATQDLIFLTNKLTASLNVESATLPTSISLMIQNNYQESVFWDTTASKFRIPVKHLYLDNAQNIELTPANYANGLAVYFQDGTRVPADYTCFIAKKSTSNNMTTTFIYKVGTKGSENVLKKNLGDVVATYIYNSGNTSSNTSTLGVATNNTIQNIEFEDYTFDGTGCQVVASEEFVSLKKVSLYDIIDIISKLKVMMENNQGPWNS